MSDRFNSCICKYLDIVETCSFCGLVEESSVNLFCDCTIINTFMVNFPNVVQPVLYIECNPQMMIEVFLRCLKSPSVPQSVGPFFPFDAIFNFPCDVWFVILIPLNNCLGDNQIHTNGYIFSDCFSDSIYLHPDKKCPSQCSGNILSVPLYYHLTTP